MDLDRLAAMAQIVSALAVTLTLLGLIVSIRQNTRSQKALAVDSLAAAIASINVPAMESPALGSALSRAVDNWTSATRDERIMWYGWDNAARKYYHSQGVREVWWPNRRQAYSAEFQQYLAGTTAPADIGSLKDIFDCETRTR